MTDSTKKPETKELNDADLDEVAGGLFSMAGTGTEVVSGPIPGNKKGDGLASIGAKGTAPKGGGVAKFQDGNDLI